MDPGAGMAKISPKDIRQACCDLGGRYVDFNQIYTNAFNVLCDDDDTNRPGLCHGLSIIWMHYATKGQPNIITSNWVDGTGWSEVMMVCNNMFDDPSGGTWSQCADKQMQLKGFKNPQPFENHWRKDIEWFLENYSYTTVELYKTTESFGHTVSVYKTTGGMVHFFDANEGYFCLPSMQKFMEWYNIWAEIAERDFGDYYKFVCYT